MLFKESVTPVSLDSPDALRLALANSTTSPVTPESLDGVSPLSRWLYAISACECLRNVRIFCFSRVFFPPVQGLYYFTAEVYSYYDTV